MKKPKGEYSIQTVINALRLLEEFQDAEELGVTHLSRRLDLHKNNVFRLLATLEERGYVEQSPETDRYRLGIRTLELGRAFSRSRSLLERARPVLRDLADTLGESTHLGVLRDFQVVHLDGKSPDRMVLQFVRIGGQLPVHCTALGKVLIACSPESMRETFDRTVAARGLERRTAATIVDRDKFFEHLRTVAVQGFALEIGECEDGLCCAAAPIYDGHGELVAALSASGPVFRLDEEGLLRRVAPTVAQAADRLSRDLGYSP
ncbi:MAG: IclR family transcriptional regulator [Myxococcales bacterium]|nr:IclR family transcriptional regulator [Myxococcales bacterium]